MTDAIEDALQKIPVWNPTEIQKVERLSGGWTNRNYRITCADRSYVLRVFGDATAQLGIDRRQEYETSVTAAEAGIAPNVRYWNETDGLLVTDYVEGVSYSPEAAAQPENVRRLALTLREIHSLRAAGAAFCPFERAKQWTEAARKLGVEIPVEYEWIPPRMQAIRNGLCTPDTPSCFCHNDFVRSNIIDSGRLWVIDWEYAGAGNPLFDLASVAMNWQPSEESEALLLQEYFGKNNALSASALAPWKRLYDYLNAAFYLLQKAASRQGLDYDYGLTHHLARLSKHLRSDEAAV